MDYLKRSWVEIDLRAMLSNLDAVKRMHPDTTVMAVVKADAYGHGAKVVAPFLEKNGVNWFAVSNVDEAMELRYAGITSPVLVLGHTPVEYAKILAKNNISQTVMSKEYAQQLSDAARAGDFCLNIHIKLDTGMNRIGFVCREDCDPTREIVQILGDKQFNYEGLFTHFSVADTDAEFTALQCERFNLVRENLEKAGYTPSMYHCSNSAAILLHPECKMSAVRAGIVLYGLTPDSSVKLPSQISPVMSFYSTVVQVKEVKEGDGISYGLTYKPEKPVRVATLPVGYADGFRRALSSGGQVLVGDSVATVAGRVCMDQTVVELPDGIDVRVGDKVELFGKNLPVEKMAERCDTINYEIICGISRRVPRVYTVGENKILAKSYIHEEEK